MRRKNSLSLKEALELMVNELNLRTKLDEVRIRDEWKRLMGKPIAKYTQSIVLREGKLYIKVDSAALKQELSYSRDKIKELFNKELGNTAIYEVVVY